MRVEVIRETVQPPIKEVVLRLSPIEAAHLYDTTTLRIVNDDIYMTNGMLRSDLIATRNEIREQLNSAGVCGIASR